MMTDLPEPKLSAATKFGSEATVGNFNGGVVNAGATANFYADIGRSSYQFGFVGYGRSVYVDSNGDTVSNAFGYVAGVGVNTVYNITQDRYDVWQFGGMAGVGIEKNGAGASIQAAFLAGVDTIGDTRQPAITGFVQVSGGAGSIYEGTGSFQAQVGIAPSSTPYNPFGLPRDYSDQNIQVGLPGGRALGTIVTGAPGADGDVGLNQNVFFSPTLTDGLYGLAPSARTSWSLAGLGAAGSLLDPNANDLGGFSPFGTGGGFSTARGPLYSTGSFRPDSLTAPSLTSAMFSPTSARYDTSGAFGQTNPSSSSSDLSNAVQQSAAEIDATNQVIASTWLAGNSNNSSSSSSSNYDSSADNYASSSSPSSNYDYSAYSGNSYASNSYSYPSYSSYSYSSYGGDYGGGDFGPVVLDLAGKGINITKLSSSNTFFDVTGDGYKNQTAWAGVGNGMLFVDTTGAGLLTQANQVIFTKWDPGAKSDMQALLDVFDTNHNGTLDAGDTNFNNFFVMVTNADGTQTAHSLANLGITSINLNADAKNIALDDGSSIDGETTFTTVVGGVTTTHVAATVSLAADTNGYVVTTTATANASDNSETITNIASYADGSLAYERILNTSSNHLSKTLTNLDSGGVVTTIQTDNTVVNANGSTTETVTNYFSGAIQANGELTASGTTGSEKLNSTTTTTSANGLVVTILRDQLGGGWTTQQEVDTTNPDLSTSIVVSNLNPDLTPSNVTTTIVSPDGLTRTVTSLVDNIAADSTSSLDATVVSGATRTETMTNSVGNTVTSKITTVTQTAANSVTRTTSSDLTDGVTLNLTSATQTVTNANGSTTTTQTDRSADTALLDETVTQVSADGLQKTTSIDSTGLQNAGVPVFDAVITDNTVVNVDGSRTETVTTTSANNTQLSQSITARAATGAARTATVYGNGDGKVTQSETVAINTATGVTTDTASALNADGTLLAQTVTQTWSTVSDLEKTIQVDSTGATTSGGSAVFDHTTTDETLIADGGSVETVTDYGASTANLIDVTMTIVTDKGLTRTVFSDFIGVNGGAADGGWDQIATDQTQVNGDGSLTETITVSDGHNINILDQTVKLTSTDRRTVTTTSTLGTSGLVKQVETVRMQDNGAVVDSVLNFDHDGDVLNATVTTTNADGLRKTIQHDVRGETAAVYQASGLSGLSFDSTTTETIVINADGSRTETTDVTPNTGPRVSTSSVSTSANGLLVTTTQNPFATAHYATRSTAATNFNIDGSSTKTTSDYSYGAALIDQTTTTTSANGLSTTILHDFDGGGFTDQSTTDVTTINANGSRTEVVTDYTGGTNGTVRDITTATSGIIIPYAGLETTVTRQSYGSVPTYQVETILPSANGNGTVTDTTKTYSQPGGTLLRTTTNTTSANGLIKVFGTAINADTSNDFSTSDTIVLNPDGSRTETVVNSNAAGLISETVTKTSANGLSRTTSVDANGTLSGVTPIFNLVTTDNTVLNASDGSRKQTITNSNANGVMISQAEKTTSADQQTININRYLNQTSTPTRIDQNESIQTQPNGSVVDAVSSYGATTGLLGTVVTTTSGNGLSWQKVYKNASSITFDTQSDTTTYDVNGDGGTLEDFEDADLVGPTTLTSSVKAQTSANGQTKTTTMALSGALASTLAASFTAVASTVVAIDDAGVTSETTTDKLNGLASVNDTKRVVTSANGLSKTTYTSLTDANPYIVQTTSVASDGSKSEVATYFNPAYPSSIIVEQVIVNTTYDGRTVTTTSESDYDGTKYNFVTDIQVQNADFTTTETRTSTGSFGAPVFKQVVTVATNADASQTTKTSNYNGSGTLIGEIVADVSANGLVRSFAYDTTGLESIANLNAAAAALLTGAALPASMLPTDIIESDRTTLNTDGSKTEVVQTGYGNSFANLRSRTTATTSPNGLVTVTQIDNDGNNIYEQKDTTTRNPDGSSSTVYTYYDNGNGTTVVGSNTYVTSANGLVTVLTPSGGNSTGITDTRVDFANSNGSYQWSRTVAAGSAAYTYGYRNESASHSIDANGLDTWTLNYINNLDPSSTLHTWTSTIDVATEKQDIAIANELLQTLLGHSMNDAQTQEVGQYITNGVFDRVGLANWIVQNYAEYLNNWGIQITRNGVTTRYYEGFDVLAAFENALGRLPTAEEMATFDSYMSNPTAANLATMIAAVAEYAANQHGVNYRTSNDPNQNLVSTSPQWISPASGLIQIGTAGTYAYTGKFLADANSSNGIGVTITVNGNNDVLLAYQGSIITLTGFNNSVDMINGSVSLAASNTAVMIEYGTLASVTGSNDQIAQVGNTQLTLTSGTGDAIFVSAASPVSGTTYSYTYAYSTTVASNASITLGSGVGTAAAAALVRGSNDTIALTGNDYLTLDPSGTGDTINVLGSNDTITASNATINIASGITGVTIIGTGDRVIGVPSDTTVIESFGSISLVRIGNGYLLDTNSTGIGPELKSGGTAWVTGIWGAWNPIGVEVTATGYEVAWKLAGANLYTVWNTDTNGKLTSNPISSVPGTSAALEAFETNFHQDLNGDGLIGVPVSIETFGSTSLVVVGQNYFLDSNISGTGPELMYGGTPLTVGQFTWTPIAAEQTSSGYEVALWNAGTSQYSGWNTDSSGNVTSSLIGAVSGSSATLKSLEFSFHQDLNGDGVISLPGAIESFGSTSLVQSGNNYYLDSNSTDTGPVLNNGGTAWVAGSWGAWNPIGVEVRATGYQVAWKQAGYDLYMVYNTDSNGNITTQAIGGVTGSTPALEAFETNFHQDLNGDGTIGVPGTIELFGSTSLVVVGQNYFLDSNNSGIGPELTLSGSPVTVGGSAWTPIAAEQTSTGYEVALKNASTNQYTVWNTDSSGNVTYAPISAVSGTSVALVALEPSFHQDLNGDGLIGFGGSPVILDLNGDGVSLSLLGASNATFDMTGDGQRVQTAWASAGDGFLAIDLGANGQGGPDGVIDQSKEIVFTEWAPGTTSDMDALRQVFDTNHDGKLDAVDGRWSDFRIWQDANGDGISDPGEVKTLDQLGITSIDLTPTGPALSFADGSVIQGLSTYSRADGTTGVAADVTLAYSATTDAAPSSGEPAASPTVLPAAPTLGLSGWSNQAFDTSRPNMIESQLNQFVQAMATHTTSSAGFDSLVASNAQLPTDQTHGAIGQSWH